MDSTQAPVSIRSWKVFGSWFQTSSWETSICYSEALIDAISLNRDDAVGK